MAISKTLSFRNNVSKTLSFRNNVSKTLSFSEGVGISADALTIWGNDLLTWHREEKVLSGSNTSQWTDKTVNGNHATQSTDADRPVWTSDIIDDDPGPAFDGVTDFLEVQNNYTTSFRDSWTKVFVCNFADGQPASNRIFWGTSRFVGATNFSIVNFFVFSDGRIRMSCGYKDTSFVVETASGYLPNGQTDDLIIAGGVINNYLVAGDVKFFLRVNGTEEDTNVATFNLGVYGTTNTPVNPYYGARNNNGGADLFTEVDFVESMYITDSDHTKIQDTETYLSNRYNISI